MWLLQKKTYEAFYNTIKRNFYLTMQQVSKDEKDETIDDFLRQNFWWEDVDLQLDSWIAFYFKFGRFPSSQKLISIPKVNLPRFLRTDLPISPVK